jgi:carbamoyl-phosphate synthase large subunit
MGLRYEILSKDSYSLRDYVIVSLRYQDIQEIRKWRNEQLHILRQKHPISTKQQEYYYHNVIHTSYFQKHPELILFSILRDKICIGYGGLVHIDWHSKRAEVSFLTSLERTSQKDVYEQDFSTFLSILKNIAFSELGLQRLSTETFDIRPDVIKILENNGFVAEGRMTNHNYIGSKYVDSILHGCINQENFQHSGSTNSPGNRQISSEENILVTSISQKIPLLNCIKTLISDVFPNTLLIGCDANPDCLGKAFVDIFWHCPADSELTLKKIITFCFEHSVKYIIPTRDGELLFYAEVAQQLLKNDIHVMISPKEAVVVCLDKLLFANHLSSHLSAPIIPTTTHIDASLKCRMAVKERNGSGSQNTFLNLEAQEAINAAESVSSPVFQPQIDGAEYSIDMYLSLKSVVIGVVVRSRDVIIYGESKVTTITENIILEKFCEEIAVFLKLTGHVVFQAIVDKDDKIHILECNCRIGGASTLSFKAGLTSIRWFIEECRTGITPKRFKSHSLTKMRMIRIPQDTFHRQPASEEEKR